MSRFQATIWTATSGEFGGGGPADSPAHAELLRWRDNWRQWKETAPDGVLPFGDYRIRVGDVTDIRVEVQA